VSDNAQLKELGMTGRQIAPAFQIQIAPDVCCELTRICLRQHDDDLDESRNGEEDWAPARCDVGLGPSVCNA